MIQISRKAIDSTLGELINDNETRQLANAQLHSERRIKLEKPYLSKYIDSGIELLSRLPLDMGRLMCAGFRSGSVLTFRMIEEQLRLDGQQSPDITREDVERAGKGLDIALITGADSPAMTKLALIRAENPEFGDYVKRYVKSQAPNESIATGFGLGVVTTYTAYEQAFQRPG